MAHSHVGKIIEDITGKSLPAEPRDPWEAGRGDPNFRPSPAACVLYGLEMRAKAKREAKLRFKIARYMAKAREAIARRRVDDAAQMVIAIILVIAVLALAAAIAFI